MQLSNIPSKLVLPFANGGSKNSIPVASQIGITPGAASLTDGFPPLTMTPVAAGGVPPSGLDMNGILYEISAIIRWANAGGGYSFDATFATDTNVNGYPKGARIMRADGLGYWFNTVENNVTDPESADAAAAGWVPDFTTGAAAVAMASANVTLTPAQYGKPLIVITGALTANLNLILPNIPFAWSIIDNTSGPFVITAKTQTGAGFILSKGFANLAVCQNNQIVSLANNFSIKVNGFYADGVSGNKVDNSYINDGTAGIQQAHDLAVAIGNIYGFAQVEFDSGTYKITSLNWSPLVKIKCNGTVVLKSTITSGKGLYISTRFGNWNTVEKQLYYAGNKLIDGKLIIQNANGKGAPAIGIFFGDDGVATYSAEGLSIDDSVIYGWGKGVSFGSHAYNLSFNHLKFEENDSDIYAATGNGVDIYSDSYERMNFTNCVFAGATNVIDGDANWHGDWMFNCCSFDAMTRINTNIVSISILNFVNCHYEWQGSETIIYANSAVNIVNPYFVKVSGVDAMPLIASIGNGGLLKVIAPTYITPAGVTLFNIAHVNGAFFGETERKQFGGVEAMYCANTGGGRLAKIITSADFTGQFSLISESSVTLPDGIIIKTGTVPTTAIGSNATVNTPVTFPTPFPNACLFAKAASQPDASADFYGVTQDIAPTATGFTFAVRNGAIAQNFVNTRWFAIGF